MIETLVLALNLPMPIYLLIASVLFLFLTVLLERWLDNKGAKKFAEL